MKEIMERLPEPMQLNITVLVIAGIFLVLIVILNNLIFKPLAAVLEDRERRIREGAEAGKKSRKTVEESEAAYQRAMIEARKKAQASRQNLLKETEMARDEMITSSKEKAMALIQAATTDVDRQVTVAEETLQTETREIARQIVSTVLSRSST